MSNNYTSTGILMTALDCCECGAIFGISSDRHRTLRENGGIFHCPNGHSQSYTESVLDKLKKQLNRTEKSRDRANERVSELHLEVESEQRKTAAQRGQVTKLKNRAKNGVCPCCARSFANLRRHMATKHPNYAEVSGERGGE